MLRRMLPTLIALAAGFLVLAWGLLRLQQVFRLERDEARDGIASRRGALARYAERTLAHELEVALRDVQPEIERALADPLAAAGHLLCFDRGDQRLPRRFVPRQGSSTPGGDLFEALRRGRAAELHKAAEPDSPWARRLVLYQRFTTAVGGDRDGQAASAEVASTFRAILAHRRRYLIRRDLDLPYMLALLDFFATTGRPDPALLRALLHDGLSDGRGGTVRDLSRLFLENRERFTVADFELLSDRLVQLAESSGAPYQAFLARVREETGTALDPLPGGGVPESDESDESDKSDKSDDSGTRSGAPALILGGSWYLAPATPGQLLGVAVDFDGLLARIGGEMERLGLIATGDRVLAVELPAGRVEIDDLRLRLASPVWEQTAGDVEARYSLKTGLVVVSAIFALAIVTLAVVLQHRRHRLLELKADFVATVSHELRTPLASVRLLGETLERRLAGHAPARDYPSRIVREIDGLSFLVENILSFNRLEKTRWRSPGRGQVVRIQSTAVPLVELMDFLRSELELHFTKTVRLESDGLDDLTLRGDPELLKLLLLNLARNACQYNARETVVISVTAVGGTGDRGCLHFRDNGWGLAAGETRKVFTEFYRSRTAGVKGTGLGLAICRRIMKLHGGEIRVAETSEEGTTFELRFRT